MANLKSRVDKLEQAMCQEREAPNITLQFIRPENGFCCAYMRPKTGEEVTQGDSESDIAFVVRAKAAGFEMAGHHANP